MLTKRQAKELAEKLSDEKNTKVQVMKGPQWGFREANILVQPVLMILEGEIIKQVLYPMGLSLSMEASVCGLSSCGSPALTVLTHTEFLFDRCFIEAGQPLSEQLRVYTSLKESLDVHPYPQPSEVINTLMPVAEQIDKMRHGIRELMFSYTPMARTWSATERIDIAGEMIKILNARKNLKEHNHLLSKCKDMLNYG